MNKEFFKLNDNDYFVSNEKGKIEKIYINSDFDIIDEVLSKENKIEELKQIEEDYKIKLSLFPKKIEEKGNSIKRKKLYSFGLMCGFCLASFVSFEYLFFIPISVILGGTTCYFIKEYFKDKKELSSIYMKIYNLKECKRDIENKVDKLSKELINIKKLISYKRLPAKKEQINLYNEIKKKENEKIKVLRKVK